VTASAALSVDSACPPRTGRNGAALTARAARGVRGPATCPSSLTQNGNHVARGDASPALVGDSLYVFSRQEPKRRCLPGCRHRQRAVEVGVSGQLRGVRPASIIPVRGVHRRGRRQGLHLGGRRHPLLLRRRHGRPAWRANSPTNDYLGVPYKTDSSMSPIVETRCIVHVGLRPMALSSLHLASVSQNGNGTATARLIPPRSS